MATIATKELPTAVCSKSLRDGRVLAVAGQGEPIVRLYDVETFEERGELAVDAELIDYLYGSDNPDDPFIYYSTQSSADRDRKFKANRLGRLDVVSMKSLGQAASIGFGTGRDPEANVYDVVTSADGEVLYHRRSVEGGGASIWATNEYASYLQPFASSGYCYGIWPGPFGQSVGVGHVIMSRNLWRRVAVTPFEVKGFFRDRPVVMGIGEGGTLRFGSANTYKDVASVPLPPGWFSGRSTRDFRTRPELSSHVKTNFLDVYADDRRQLGLVVFHKQLVIAPLARLQLPVEKSLIVKKRPPTTVFVDQEVTVDLRTEAADAKFEVVTREADEPGKDYGPVKPLGARSLAATTFKPFLALAAAVNPQQTTILVRDVGPIVKLTLPQTVLIGEEHVTVTAVDSFKNALTVTRNSGVLHSVADPIRRIDTHVAEAPNMPTVEGNVFTWSPSADQIGKRTICMRVRSGAMMREWFWDVTVARPSFDAPFYVTGANLDADEKLAAVWGQSQPRQGKPAHVPDSERTFYVGVFDVRARKLLRYKEVPAAIYSAVFHPTGLYACLNRAATRHETPTQLIRFDPESLETQDRADAESHFQPQVIADRYVAGLGRWGRCHRLTVPDLKPAEPALADYRYLHLAASRGEDWVWDGVLWDSALETPKLLMYPALFGVTPPRDGREILVEGHGRVALTLQSRITPPPAKSLEDAVRKLEDEKMLGSISRGRNFALVAMDGKLSVIATEPDLPHARTLRFVEQQSTFVLHVDKPNTVRYSAPGAAQFQLMLWLRQPDSSFVDDPYLRAESANGEFSIALETPGQLVSDAIRNSEQKLKQYLDAVTPSFERLVGRPPHGVPVPVFVAVLAQSEDGLRKAHLVHSYLVEIPPE